MAVRRKRKTAKRASCAPVKTTAKRRKTTAKRKASSKKRSFWDMLWND